METIECLQKDSRKLAAIAIVAADYGGDMHETLCYDLLDDIDFHYNKVKCRKIEQKLTQLNTMAEEEMKTFVECREELKQKNYEAVAQPHAI